MGRKRRSSVGGEEENGAGPSRKLKRELEYEGESEVSEPTSSDEDKARPAKASASTSALTLKETPLSPSELDDVLEQIPGSYGNTPFRKAAFSRLRIKAPDGLLYDPAYLKAEFARYWNIMRTSQGVSIKTFNSAFRDLKATQEFIGLYPDAPKTADHRSGFTAFKSERIAKTLDRKRKSLGEGKKLERSTIMEANGQAARDWQALTPEEKMEWNMRALEAKEKELAELKAFLQKHEEVAEFQEPHVRESQAKLVKERRRLCGPPVPTGLSLFHKAKADHYATKYHLDKTSEELAAKVAAKFDLLAPAKKEVWEQKAHALAVVTPRKHGGLGRPSAATPASSATPRAKAAKTAPAAAPTPSFEAFVDAKTAHYSEKYDLPLSSPKLRIKLQKRWDKMDDEKKAEFV